MTMTSPPRGRPAAPSPEASTQRRPAHPRANRPPIPVPRSARPTALQEQHDELMDAQAAAHARSVAEQNALTRQLLSQKVLHSLRCTAPHSTDPPSFCLCRLFQPP